MQPSIKFARGFGELYHYGVFTYFEFAGNTSAVSQYFQHQLSLDPTSLVKWRKRIGPKGMEKLLVVTIETTKSEDHVSKEHLKRVNVDTTVQEKTIALPGL